MHSITQHCLVDVALDSTDIDNTTATSLYCDLSEFGTVTFIVEFGTTLEGTADGVTAANNISFISPLQATSAAGAGAKVIGDAAGTTINLGGTLVVTAGQKFEVTVNSEALDVANDFKFVCLKLGEDANKSVYATVVALRYNSRYMHDDLTASTDSVFV